MRNKSGFLVFCFSFVPGAGQMYQGYMRRGISMLLALCAAWWMNWFCGAFSILIPIVWMVSFFDTFNLRSRLLSGMYEPDAFLFDFAKDDSLQAIVQKKHRLIGWGLVALGVYALYNKFVLGQLYWYLEEHGLLDGVLGNVYAVLNRVPELLVCLAVIAVGIWLVKGPQRPESRDYNEYRPESEE